MIIIKIFLIYNVFINSIFIMYNFMKNQVDNIIKNY